VAEAFRINGTENNSLEERLDYRVEGFSGDGIFDFYFTVIDKD
jgi:hypothetical protein